LFFFALWDDRMISGDGTPYAALAFCCLLLRALLAG